MPITGSGYKILDAVYTKEKLKYGTRTYLTNSFDGSNQHIVWKQLDAQYYRYPYDRVASLEAANERYTYKFLNYSASIFQVPQHDFGDGIKAGSVQITGSGFSIKDDGNGNLYDVSYDIDSSDIANHVVARWGFDEAFLNGEYVASDFEWRTNNTTIPYTSRTFSVENRSYTNQIVYSDSYSFTSLPDGLYAEFTEPQSYIRTEHRDELNLDGDFTISFWIVAFEIQYDNPTIISKNGVLNKTMYSSNGEYTSSIVNESTNVYPFEISIETSGSDFGKFKFKRSNGIDTATMLTISDLYGDSWHHIAVTKEGSSLSMYFDGSLQATAVDNLGFCGNRHDLMFGRKNLVYQVSDSAFHLDEIRMYDVALDFSQIATLARFDLAAFQSPVVGNVFYKTGKIVMGGLHTLYNQSIFSNDFTLKFRSTHTIYQYETLVRIKKGDFNLTYNPSARQSPYSDLIIPEMTGSMEDGALMPYMTTIGLYNDKAELLVVGKLGQPLRMRSDTDINIIVKFDL